MNNNILTSYEDDNKRITVHYDMCADAPNRKEEFLGKILYTYDSGHLHDMCDYEDITCEPRGTTIAEALADIAVRYVPTRYIKKYLQNECDEYWLHYNKSEHIWYFNYCSDRRADKWVTVDAFEPCQINRGDANEQLLRQLNESELYCLICKYGKNIVITSRVTKGYCQGECQEMYAYCDKSMYKDMFGKLPKDWQSDAETTMQDELKQCGQWMWGDNYLVTIEEKITYTKRYGDGTEIEDYEYRHVDTYDITCDDCEEALEIVKEYA